MARRSSSTSWILPVVGLVLVYLIITRTNFIASLSNALQGLGNSMAPMPGPTTGTTGTGTGTTTTDGTTGTSPCICDNTLAGKNCGNLCTCTACWVQQGTTTPTPCTPTQADISAATCPRTLPNGNKSSKSHSSKSSSSKSSSSPTGVRPGTFGTPLPSHPSQAKAPTGVRPGTFGTPVPSRQAPAPHPFHSFIPGLAARVQEPEDENWYVILGGIIIVTLVFIFGKKLRKKL